MLQLQRVDQEGPQLEAVQQLFRQYEAELEADLCFQQFEAELRNPLNKYGGPGGRLYLAYWNGAVAGCIALYPLPDKSSCEMKRLYVVPAYRQHQIGKALVAQLLQDAAALGYHTMKLDTLEKLKPAIALYQHFGFEVTTAYYHNPLPGVVYMEKQLCH